ncbi:MAG: MarR family winged helix-turn-helix transcriptional regulator [Oscillospiraceae bacterium]|jgi:DNA-binding MarR family transcriptional regulator
MEFNECINYLLTTAQHAVFQQMTERLSEHDITPGQYAILNCLWTHQSVNPKEIAKILCLETSTISGVMDRMQKKGIIDRLVSTEDRRCVQVMLTEKGRNLEEPVLHVVEEVNKEVMSGFTPEEQALLKDCLRRIAGHEEAGILGLAPVVNG